MERSVASRAAARAASPAAAADPAASSTAGGCADASRLRDLRGVGAATLRDLAVLGVSTVAQLAARDHRELYARLNERYRAARARGAFVGVAGLGPELDACVLDTLECAIAQARDAALPAEQRLWGFYSRRRKAEAAALREASAGTARKAKVAPPPQAAAARKRHRDSSRERQGGNANVKRQR